MYRTKYMDHAMKINRNERLVVISILIFSSSPVYAYLDPGTGSILLQGAIAAIATLAYTAKLYWYRIKAFISGKPYVPLDMSETDEQNHGEDSETKL